jgi:hypothetical protein
MNSMGDGIRVVARAPAVQFVDVLSREAAGPVEDRRVVTLICPVGGGVLKAPKRVQSASQGASEVARLPIAEALVPVLLVEVVGVPDPVDEFLWTGARTVQEIPRRVHIAGGSAAVGHYSDPPQHLPAGELPPRPAVGDGLGLVARRKGFLSRLGCARSTCRSSSFASRNLSRCRSPLGNRRSTLACDTVPAARSAATAG